MSYPRDIDEIPGAELTAELDRRLDQRNKGLCDYCGRTPETEPCLYYERHVVGGKEGN